jgi:hypothetical protein
MTDVSPQDRQAMTDILNLLNGNQDRTSLGPSTRLQESNEVELAGAGQITQRDISAMAGVLERLNNVSNSVVDTLLTESVDSPIAHEALNIERMPNGVKVGRYKISIREDDTRLAGKQFYSIYNSLTKELIADDLSLYETAITVVRMLNNGKFVNSPEVRKLFDHDDLYTSHKVDALLYKSRYAKTKDISKRDIYESRYQASLDRCMSAKKIIKGLAADVR